MEKVAWVITDSIKFVCNKRAISWSYLLNKTEYLIITSKPIWQCIVCCLMIQASKYLPVQNVNSKILHVYFNWFFFILCNIYLLFFVLPITGTLLFNPVKYPNMPHLCLMALINGIYQKK